MEKPESYELVAALLALLKHRETPTASPEAEEAATILKSLGYQPKDFWNRELPYTQEALDRMYHEQH